jgi:hypothetical protein
LSVEGNVGGEIGKAWGAQFHKATNRLGSCIRRIYGRAFLQLKGCL